MNEDIERTLRDSLDRHAAAAARPAGQLDDVYGRVDLRRRRRRSIAVVGSFVVVGVGVAGFAAMAANGPDTGSNPFDGALGSPSDTTYVLNEATTWSCFGYLGTAGDRDLYADCHPIADGEAGVVECVPTSTAPPTTMSVEGTGPAVVVGTPPPDPCALAPAYDLACVPAATAPPPTVAVTWPATSAPIASDPIDPCSGAYATTVPGTVPPATAPASTAIAPVVDTHPPGVLDCRTAGTDPDGSATTTTTVLLTDPTTPGEQVYAVVAGDTLVDIARRHGVEPEALANYNGWADCLDHVLFVGDQILIPPGALTTG